MALVNEMEPVGCAFCDRDFDMMADLYRHVYHAHPEEAAKLMRPAKPLPEEVSRG